MCEEDAYILLNNLEKKYNAHGYYSKEEVALWFLTRKNAIYSYIKNGDNNKVTYFISFYNL